MKRVFPSFSVLPFALAFAACGTEIHNKYDAAPPAPKTDAQIVIVYVTPDAAPPPVCVCDCAMSPCTCTCSGEPAPTTTSTAPGKDAAPAATADAAASKDGVAASDPIPANQDALAAPDTAAVRDAVSADSPTDKPTIIADSAQEAPRAYDTQPDAANDPANSNTGPDASVDKPQDLLPDFGPDLPPDLGPDLSSPDTAPDMSPDLGPDLPPALTATCPAYVDGNAIVAGTANGSPLAPWPTIQAAINNPSRCDTIIVKRGTYREQVSCNYTFNGTLKSEEGAGVTIIDRSGSTDRPYGIELVSCSVTIEGFTIANAAQAGIDVYSVPYTTIIQHNILLHNNRGISVIYGPGNGNPVIIRNNIIIGDPNATSGPYIGTGVHQGQSGGLRLVENNLIIGNVGTSSTSAGVFIDNWATGYAQNNIIADGYNGILRYYDYNTMTLQYNCLFGNVHDYVSYAAAGTGDIHADPNFVNPGNGDVGTADFHLTKDSPCRNAGNPDPAYNNSDGTRNDIGPYGGPYGAW
jgi:hypothetical protein